MVNSYEIRSTSHGFDVVDGAGETVGVYKTLQKAKKEIEVTKKDDLMYETARRMVKRALRRT
jgi:hypothetical protein